MSDILYKHVCFFLVINSLFQAHTSVLKLRGCPALLFLYISKLGSEHRNIMLQRAVLLLLLPGAGLRTFQLHFHMT
jgi:hypothetical protein